MKPPDSITLKGEAANGFVEFLMGKLPAERSGVLQGCPPSATGSADAGASDETGADSSGRCPEVNGPCPIANAVALQVLKRSEAGFRKYGTTCARNDLTTIQWLQHLQEELLDASVYIERIKQELGRDAGQCNGQRVLPDNEKLTDPAAKKQ